MQISSHASCIHTRFRNLNVTEAKNMLVATLKWRETFKPEEAVTEEFPADIFGQLGHVYGHDKEGRPVTCVLSLSLMHT